MSFLWRISRSDRLMVKIGFPRMKAYYSDQRKIFELLFKIVNSSGGRDRSDKSYVEGGPNWELFNPQGNRFYLPNGVGLGWQNRKTIAPLNVPLDRIIDFDIYNNIDKLHISINRCPTLIRLNLHEQFPELTGKTKAMMVITLSYRKDADVESGAKQFVIAANEICQRLHKADLWADFVNPFSGRAFFGGGPLEPTTDVKPHASVRIINENKYKCLVITPDVKSTFSGNIFAYGNSAQDLKFKIEYGASDCYSEDEDDDDIGPNSRW